jgi:hypothetical protein
MKNRSALFAFILLILAASLYRVFPGRPFGFAPQWAMAVFGGAVIKDKRLAAILPLISIFISDTLYQLLFINGQSTIWGFYEGQLTNYILFGSLVVFGFMIRKKTNWVNIIAASLAASSAFFLISNFLVWNAGAGYARPHTFAGLTQCYGDGVPFYQMSLIATVSFSIAFFGIYFLIRKFSVQKERQLA